MHDHSHEHATGDKRLILAIGANLLLTVAEVVGGVLSGSLSLIADALHNLSDVGSLFVALVARKVSRWPADRSRTFGYRRAEMVGALINNTTLVVIGLYLLFEAASRYFSPEPVAGWIMIWVSGIALIVDLLTALLTFAMSRESLNIRAAFIHNVADALGTLAVIAAGVLILRYEWYAADLIATLLIAGYVLCQGITMMSKSIRGLMDSVPEDIEVQHVVAHLSKLEGVDSVHHVHIWELGENYRALEAHVVLSARGSSAGADLVRRRIKEELLKQFDIQHSTIETETDAA